MFATGTDVVKKNSPLPPGGRRKIFASPGEDKIKFLSTFAEFPPRGSEGASRDPQWGPGRSSRPKTIVMDEKLIFNYNLLHIKQKMNRFAKY